MKNLYRSFICLSMIIPAIGLATPLSPVNINNQLTSKTRASVKHLFSWLNSLGEKGQKPTHLSSLIGKNITYVVNGIALAHNKQQLLTQWKKESANLKSKHANVNFEKMLVINNSAAVQYELTVKQNNGVVKYYACTSILNFNNKDQLTSWQAVSVPIN